MSDTKHYDLIVIGAGPSGLTSAMYAARAGLKVLVLDRGLAGGQMNNTAGVENYPGFKNVLGRKLGQKMFSSTSRFHFDHTYGNVESVKHTDSGNVVTTDMAKYHSRALVIATGAQQRHLGVPDEKKYAGHGVSYCAVCDANFFKDMPVIVVGGGDSAFTEAEYLSHIVSHVTIMVRKPHAQAEKTVVDRISKIPNISIMYNAEVNKINGDGTSVQSVDVLIKHRPVSKPVKTRAVFIYIGMVPSTEFLAGSGVHLDSYHWIVSDKLMKTNIPGIFATGDVRKDQIRQIATAVGNGAVAGREVYQYLISRSGK